MDNQNDQDNSLENPSLPISPAGAAAGPVGMPGQPTATGPVVIEPANPNVPPPLPSLSPSPAPASSTPPPERPSLLARLLIHLNIYAVIFVVLLLLAGGIIALTLKSSGSKTPATSKVPSLTDSEIANLKGATTVVGSSSQTLDVQSDSVFERPILARSNLDVAGNIKIGGNLSLPSISVSGQSNFNNLAVGNGLTVAGDTNIQGQVTLHKGLNVSGAASVGSLSASSITVSSLQFTGDLNLSRHIVTTGSSPSKSSGSALGSGGTASVSGTDTAGTININTGGSPAAGLFITVNFAHGFATTPHVLLTPVGSTTGSLDYYVSRSSSSFSVGVSSAAPANKSFAFDYFVIQ